MDLILRRARPSNRAEGLFDIGIERGRIAAIEPSLAAEGREVDLDGRLVSPGLIETHIHLDKSCILDRCKAETGDLDEAIREVAAAKRKFTPEDVYARARRTLEKCILSGTTQIRTHLEVDPGIGLRGLEGVLPLIEEYRWALDLEICIFPQEGLLNNPGTDELMVEALKRVKAKFKTGCITNNLPANAIGSHSGRSLYVESCRGCHALKLPHEIPAEQWAHEVAEMRQKQAVELSDAEADAIVRYLWSLAPDRANQPR